MTQQESPCHKPNERAQYLEAEGGQSPLPYLLTMMAHTLPFSQNLNNQFALYLIFYITNMTNLKL